VDVSVISEETFLRGMEEICAVVDRGLLAGSTAEDLGLPGVEMAVKVDDADWSVLTEKLSVAVVRSYVLNVPVDRS
jgi:hypothetical protein